MTTPADHDLKCAASLLEGRTRFLTRGATCTVYTDGTRVVRLSDPHPEKQARFRVDAQVRRRLRLLGVPTPQTLDLGHLPGGRAYSVEPLVRSDDLPPTPSGVAQLSAAIHALHSLVHTGFGLLQDREDALVGSCTAAGAGFQSRLHRVWPFHGAPLDAQPLVWLGPELQRPLLTLHPELLALAGLPTCVCHTDLHHNQWLWRSGELAAFLDFGDASAGPPAWDWASLAYFHGWAQAAGLAGHPLPREVALFGLLLALHRAARATTEHRPQHQAQAVQFARACLQRL